MADPKTIKISEENYQWLCEIAGETQKEMKKTISIDKALSVIHKRLEKPIISDLAGSWKMSDIEYKKFKTKIKKR